MTTEEKRQTAVTAYFSSKQLLLFAFELQDSHLPSSTGILTAEQRQTVVTAYFSSNQILLFAFELQDYLLPSSTGILSAEQRQTAVTAHFSCKQLLLFVFELQDSLLPSSTGMLTAVQRQTPVTAYFSRSSYCCLSLSCRIIFCHRVLAYWPQCKDNNRKTLVCLSTEMNCQTKTKHLYTIYTTSAQRLRQLCYFSVVSAMISCAGIVRMFLNTANKYINK